jgi:hypothetical protein
MVVTQLQKVVEEKEAPEEHHLAEEWVAPWEE